MKELINTYHPEVLWSDGEWEAPYHYWNATDFISWYVAIHRICDFSNQKFNTTLLIMNLFDRLYNDSPVRDTIVTNDRWGQDMLCKHGDFYTCADRYNPGLYTIYQRIAVNVNVVFFIFFSIIF